MNRFKFLLMTAKLLPNKLYKYKLHFMFKEIRNPNSGQAPPKLSSSDPVSLDKKVQRAVAENKRIYAQILALDSQFSYKLYQPINHEGIQEMFLKPLISRQMEHLQDEKQTLLTKKQVLNLIIGEQKSRKEQELYKNATHYSFLRSTWTRVQSQAGNSSQRIDNLSKIVGIIKNNIKHATEQEQNSIDREVANEYAKTQYAEMIIHERQRQDYQKLRMRNEQLEARCLQLSETIQEKNNKIQILQNELFQAGNRIKDSIDTLHLTSEKLLSLKKAKNLLDSEVKRLQNQSNETPYLLFNCSSEQIKVKIETGTINEMKVEETDRTLSQILQFFRSKSSVLKNFVNESSELSQLQIPCLNLNKTQSTNETVLTDRHFSKVSKFIPMRTQRSCLMKSQHLRRAGTNQLLGAENEEQALDSKDICGGLAIKRFCRKAQLPLTSDRFRKNEILNDGSASELFNIEL